MRVFFIRHGETEHNIAGLLAGSTDSRLTSHGLIQTQRLADHFIKQRSLRFNQVFASDLQRAHRTANAISEAQNTVTSKDARISTVVLPILREQDFGSFELATWSRTEDLHKKELLRDDPNFKPKETKTALKVRADTFLDDHLLPLLALDEESEQIVAVVSHGLFLAALWRAFLIRFKSARVSFAADVGQQISDRPLEHLGSWSNTGFLELRMLNQSSSSTESNLPDLTNETTVESSTLNATLKICAVNAKDHLAGLKRARGGLGSSASDESQKKVDSFFKKRKLEDAESLPAKRVR